MRCPHCGDEVPEDVTVCPGCDLYLGSKREVPPLRQSFFRSMRPKSRFDFFIIIALMIAVLGYWAFVRHRAAVQASAKKIFEAPEEIDGELVRIHRTAEEEIAAKMLERWKTRGFKESVAAVYEFNILPYKPVFFIGAAKGSEIDRNRILEEEVRIFEGSMGANEQIIESSRDGISFLCAPFHIGSGLVSLSGVCVWDDGNTVGVGLRIAGGAVEDTLRYTAEARKALVNPKPSSPFLAPAQPQIAQKEGELERTIRDIIASLKSYDCERFRTFLPAGAEEMFRERISEELLDRMKDPFQRVCFVLSTVEFPRSETMGIRKQTESDNHVVLLLVGTEIGERSAEFHLVRTSDGWETDADWALKQVQNHQVKMSLLQFDLTQKTLDQYSNDSGRKISVILGIADQFSEPGSIYGATSSDGRSICASALSESGELFMIRFDENRHATYARGDSLSGQCPGTPLQAHW